MNRNQWIILFVALGVHAVLICYLPLALMNIQLGVLGGFHDYEMFSEMVQAVLQNPVNLYPSSYLYLPAGFYILLVTTPLGLVGYLVVEVIILIIPLFVLGDIVSKKTSSLLVFTVLALLLVAGYYYTYNYRAANMKNYALVFLCLAYWLVKEKKNPILAEICLGMTASLVPYLIFILIFYILREFSWKKALRTVIIFIGLNNLFLIAPELIFRYFNYVVVGFSFQSELLYGGVFDAGFGLFTYFRFLAPDYDLPILLVGVAGLAVATLYLLVKKYTTSDFILYDIILTIMFYGMIEWQHATFLFPPLLIFFAVKYPLQVKVNSLKKLIIEWLPALCVFGLSFPIPSELLWFLPDFLEPFRRLIFSLVFFIVTLKFGLLQPSLPLRSEGGKTESLGAKIQKETE